jgi:uncharacterized protein
MEPVVKSDLHPEPSPTTGPVTEAERILTLDVLRGFALFGILMVNMPFFGMPFMRTLTDPELVQAPPLEQAAFLFVKTFFEYKFVSLFSLLFGIGFVVLLTRSGGRGEAFRPSYLRRIGVLAAIGLAHALLLWHGDILLLYAIVALLLLRWRDLPVRTLLRRSAAFLLVATTLGALAFGGQLLAKRAAGERMEAAYAKARGAIAAGEAPDGAEAMLRSEFDPANPIWQHAEQRAFRDGPLANALLFRAACYAMFLVHSLFGFGWHVLAMFLLGAAMMKSGFLLPGWRAWHRRLAFLALPAGLLLEAAHAWSYWAGGYAVSAAVAVTYPLHEIGSVLTMLGYVGVICLAVQGGAPAWLTNPVSAAGRMALTVYLSQTVISTAVMYWWGFGMFGSFSRVEMIGLTIVLYAVLAAASVLWLRAARFGPMEWIWRGLSYRTWQPLMR